MTGYNRTFLGYIFQEDEGPGSLPMIVAAFEKFEVILPGSEGSGRVNLLDPDVDKVNTLLTDNPELLKEINAAVWYGVFPETRFDVKLYDDIRKDQFDYVFKEMGRVFFIDVHPDEQFPESKCRGIALCCLDDGDGSVELNIDDLISFTTLVKRLHSAGRIADTDITVINEYE
jgi:hypothetical protein